jgi:hypothetical protein
MFNFFFYRSVRTVELATISVPFFTAIGTVTVPFFSLTVSMKRAELLILTVRFLVFDREPYRTKKRECYPFLFEHREKIHAIWFAVLNNKQIAVPILVRFDSRLNTKKLTVKING